MRWFRAGRWGMALLVAVVLGACASAPPLGQVEGQAIVADLRERVAHHQRLRRVVADYGQAEIDPGGIRLPLKVHWAQMSRAERETFLHDFASELQGALYARQPKPPRSMVRIDLADDAGASVGWVAVGGAEEGYAFEAR